MLAQKGEGSISFALSIINHLVASLHYSVHAVNSIIYLPFVKTKEIEPRCDIIVLLDTTSITVDFSFQTVIIVVNLYFHTAIVRTDSHDSYYFVIIDHYCCSSVEKESSVIHQKASDLINNYSLMINLNIGVASIAIGKTMSRCRNLAVIVLVAANIMHSSFSLYYLPLLNNFY